MALVVVGSGRGCFYRWVVLLNASNCGGTDVVVVVGGSARLVVLVMMGTGDKRWVLFVGYTAGQW